MINKVKALADRYKLVYFAVLVALTFYVYSVTQIKGATPYDYFIRLADSFLHGQYYLPDRPSHLNELVPSDSPDKWFVPYPPMPAVISIPFVLFNVMEKSQTFISLIFGSLSVGLCFLVVYKMYRKLYVAVCVALMLGFGTSYWFLATEGSSWYISHTIAVFFILCAFLSIDLDLSGPKAVFTAKLYRWLIAGLCIGAAYWSRLPTSVASIFFILLPFVTRLHHVQDLVFKNIVSVIKQNYKYVLMYLAGFACFVLLNFGYNFIRYGSITDESYTRIPGILDEPWFYDGFLSIKYIPKSFMTFAFKAPLPYEEFPYWKPSIEALSYFLVSPFMLLLPFAKWKNISVVLLFLTGVAMLIPVFMHGGGGFTQFGYRYATEATVFFLLVFGSVLLRRFWWLAIPFMLSAIAVCYWGIYFIRTLGIYGW